MRRLVVGAGGAVVGTICLVLIGIWVVVSESEPRRVRAHKVTTTLSCLAIAALVGIVCARFLELR